MSGRQCAASLERDIEYEYIAEVNFLNIFLKPFCLYLVMTRCRAGELHRCTESGRLTQGILTKNIGDIYKVTRMRS